MNFDLTEEQQILVDSVAKFVQNDSERRLRRHARTRAWRAPGSDLEQGGSIVKTEALRECQKQHSTTPESFRCETVAIVG